MGVSEWDLLGLFPLGHAWKWGDRPSRFGFRTFSDGFCGSKVACFDGVVTKLASAFGGSGVRYGISEEIKR